MPVNVDYGELKRQKVQYTVYDFLYDLRSARDFRVLTALGQFEMPMFGSG